MGCQAFSRLACALVAGCLLSVQVLAAKPLLDPSFGVHAFYYLWYGTPEHDGDYKHWDHEVLPHWNEAVQEKFPSGGSLCTCRCLLAAARSERIKVLA
jgi:hypothetical protein